MTTAPVVPEVKKLEPAPKAAKQAKKPVFVKKTRKEPMRVKKVSKALTKAQKSRKSATKRRQAAKKASRRSFPYQRVARLWAQRKTIEEIARSIGRYERDAADPLHSMRCFLHRMHTVGYKDAKGHTRKLSHRISRAAIRAATKAGRKAARG